jgi:hypothetical protein
MKKPRRTKDYYTIDPDLYKILLKHIDDNNINKSKLIESLIEDYISKFVK